MYSGVQQGSLPQALGQPTAISPPVFNLYGQPMSMAATPKVPAQEAWVNPWAKVNAKAKAGVPTPPIPLPNGSLHARLNAQAKQMPTTLTTTPTQYSYTAGDGSGAASA